MAFKNALGNVFSAIENFYGFATKDGIEHKPDKPQEYEMNEGVQQAASDLAYRSALSLNQMLSAQQQMTISTGCQSQGVSSYQQTFTTRLGSLTSTAHPQSYGHSQKLPDYGMEIADLKRLIKSMAVKMAKLESEVTLLRTRQESKGRKADDILRQMDCYIA